MEVLTYQPRHTKVRFEKPAGATFNGFPGPTTGSLLVKDEEGNWITEDEPEEAEPTEEGEDESGGDDGTEDDDFYEQWEPPPKQHVYF